MEERNEQRRGERGGRREEDWGDRGEQVVVGEGRRGWRGRGGHTERRNVEGETDGGHLERGRDRGEKRREEHVDRGRGGGERRGRGREVGRDQRGDIENVDREYQEKRLLESLTDPRDVPKGASYFEVSKYRSVDSGTGQQCQGFF